MSSAPYDNSLVTYPFGILVRCKLVQEREELNSTVLMTLSLSFHLPKVLSTLS
jgi:hypothetical protein